MDWLSGKKTHIISILTGIGGIYEALNEVFGWGASIPGWVWAIDAALFGSALRAGIQKSGLK